MTDTITIRIPHGYKSAEEFAADCGFEVIPVGAQAVAWRVLNDFGHWYITQDKALADTYRDTEKKDVQPLYLAAQPPAAPVETEEDDASYERGFKAGYEVATGQQRPQCSADNDRADLLGHDETMANIDALKVRR